MNTPDRGGSEPYADLPVCDKCNLPPHECECNQPPTEEETIDLLKGQP